MKKVGQEGPSRVYTEAGSRELLETLRHPEDREMLERHPVATAEIGIARVPADDLHHLCKTFGAPI